MATYVIPGFTSPHQNSSSWTRHHWENPGTQEEGWSTPCTTKTKMDCIRRARWMATCWLHCPQASTASHNCGSLHWSPYSGFTPTWDCRRICRTQPLGIWLWGENSNNQHSDLSRLHSYLQSPSSSAYEQLRLSAELSWWHIWPGNSVGNRSASFGSQTRNLESWSLVFWGWSTES